jgi:hypothetical protein
MNVTGKMLKDEKKWGTVESNLYLLLNIMQVFEFLDFTAV